MEIASEIKELIKILNNNKHRPLTKQEIGYILKNMIDNSQDNKSEQNLCINLYKYCFKHCRKCNEELVATFNKYFKVTPQSNIKTLPDGSEIFDKQNPIKFVVEIDYYDAKNVNDLVLIPMKYFHDGNFDLNR